MPTNSTRSQLNALTSTNFPDNTSQLISPADLRQWLDDGTASFLTQKDKSTLENAIYECEGSGLAASASVNLASATGNFLHITGTYNGIASFGNCPAGARFVLVFDGINTLTYNATSLILPGGADITTAANDSCMIISEGSGNWRVVGYFPAAGGGGGGSGTVTSVDLTMPSAFAVSGNPIITSGTLAVTGAGLASQYVRGDGTLANFPEVTGGGSSISYYLNGSVTQLTISGTLYYQMSKTPILGGGTNFIRTSASGDGYVASFITDAGDPNILAIPGGNFNIEFYFSASSGGGSPQFYAELYNYDGASLTLIASGSTNPEGITNGTTVDQYFTSISVPATSLALTDRLAVRVYVITSGRNITLHTEDNNLCQVITTISTGLTALNGLTAQVQTFATGTSGTDFTISSATNTHTFNIPDASASARGLITTGVQTLGGIKTFGNGASAGEIRLLEPSGAGTEYVAIKAPATLASNLDLVLPNASGSNTNVLSTDGSGNLYWASNGGYVVPQFLRNYTLGSVTGTTANTVAQSVLIPANTFIANTGFRAEVKFSRTVTNSLGASLYCYINTSAAIGGVQVVLVSISSGNLSGIATRSFSIASSTSTLYIASTVGGSDFTQAGAAFGNSNINWAVNQYFVVSFLNQANTQVSNCLAIDIYPI